MNNETRTAKIKAITEDRKKSWHVATFTLGLSKRTDNTKAFYKILNEKLDSRVCLKPV